jgi:hypothetical protein
VTVNDLITASLRRLRVISGADPPSGDDMNDALLRLQDWLDDLRTQDFLVLFRSGLVFPLTANKGSYECPGDVGLTTAPPFSSATEILSISTRDATGSDQLLPAVLSDDAYTALPNKTTPGTRPAYWYFTGGPGVLTPGYSAFLRPWPIPNVGGLSASITFNQPVGAMTLSTVLDGNANLPPGWRRFLRDGLALELAPEFHVNDPAVLGPLKLAADESRANIKRKQRRLRDLEVPAHFSFGGGGSNIYTG